MAAGTASAKLWRGDGQCITGQGIGLQLAFCCPGRHPHHPLPLLSAQGAGALPPPWLPPQGPVLTPAPALSPPCSSSHPWISSGVHGLQGHLTVGSHGPQTHSSPVPESQNTHMPPAQALCPPATPQPPRPPTCPDSSTSGGSPVPGSWALEEPFSPQPHTQRGPPRHTAPPAGTPARLSPGGVSLPSPPHACPLPILRLLRP